MGRVDLSLQLLETRLELCAAAANLAEFGL